GWGVGVTRTAEDCAVIGGSFINCAMPGAGGCQLGVHPCARPWACRGGSTFSHHHASGSACRCRYQPCSLTWPPALFGGVHAGCLWVAGCYWNFVDELAISTWGAGLLRGGSRCVYRVCLVDDFCACS